jgi:hypothetical protein
MDYFDSHNDSLTSPAKRHFAITPDDSSDLQVLPKCVRVGGGGALAVQDELGTVLIYQVVDGERLDFRITRILATGTTATDLVGWY